MLFRLFLLFTLVPLVELFLLLRLGGWIGAGPTLALVILTGLAGAWLAKAEGRRSWRAVQAELEEGRVPGTELLHSLMILVAGVVLVTPGVLTDAAGLLLLTRPVRTRIIQTLRRRFEARLVAGTAAPGVVSWGLWSGPGPRSEEDDEEDDGRPPRVIEL